MRPPSLDELVLQPEPLALQRHFDYRNYRLFRWLIGVALLLSMGGLGHAVEHNRIAFLLLFVANLILTLGFFAARREAFFERYFRQILVAFLFVELALLKLVTSQARESTALFAAMFMLVLVCLRLRLSEHLLLFGVTWMVGALPPNWVGLAARGEPPDATSPAVLAVTGAVFFLVAVALTGLERRRFLITWRKEHARSRERLRMLEEIEYARKIQLSMLPQGAPEVDWLDVAAASLPATEVGGDYYDYFPLASSRLALVIGDVAGHGLASGLLLSGVRSCLYLLEESLASPVEVLTRLNPMVRRTTDKRTYVTLLCAVLDPAARTLVVASAGHPPVLRHVARTRGCEEVGQGAPPLGTFLAARYVEEERALEPDDLLVFYTDGLVETPNAHGQEFGDERLKRTLARAAAHRSAREVRDAILGDLANFKGDTEQADDITVVVVRVR
jgi:serine phosphatase RsbU (regulator of sigma subunit)